MNGHDDDELDIYGPQDDDELDIYSPQDDDEWQQQQADDDEALADYYETLYWFLAGTK